MSWIGASSKAAIPLPDPSVDLPAAKAWSIWEGSTFKRLPDPAYAAHFGDEARALAFARTRALVAATDRYAG